MSMRSTRAAILVAATTAVLSSIAAADTVPSFSFGLGILESNNPAGTVLGTNTTVTTGGLEQINAAGISVPADGAYHTITFHIGTDLVTNPGLSGGNGVIDAAAAGLGALDSLRFNNTNGITSPVSIFIDDLTTDSTLITDFSTFGANTLAVGTSNVGFREPSFSSATAVVARSPASSSVLTNVQPDGTTGTNQAERLNMRFNTPEVATLPSGTTGWVRLYAGSTNASGPIRPVIDLSNGATFSARIAIVVNTPLYGFDDSANTNSNWTDNNNWGRGTAAATTNAPNSTSATALFDQPLPDGPVVAHTVTLDADQKVNILQFTTAVPYTLSGTNTLSIVRADTVGQQVIDVEAGNQTIGVPVVFAPNGTDVGGVPTIWVSGGASLTHTASLTVGTTTSPTITKRGAGSLTVPDITYSITGTGTLSVLTGSVKLAAAQTSTISTATLGSTALVTGGRLEVDAAAGQTKTITTLSVPFASTFATAKAAGSDVVVGTANIGLNSTLKLDLAGVNALHLGALGLNVTATVTTATLDVGNDGVLLDYPDANIGVVPNSIYASILLGRNGGDWQGKGITSSLLSATSRYGIGYDVLAQGRSFMGYTAADGSVFGFRYTLLGDSDIDGDVDFDDLLALAKNYDAAYDPTGPNGPKIWSQGDTNYDGISNFNDLLNLAKNYGGSVAAASAFAEAEGGAFANDFKLAQALVPEPTTLGLIGGISLLGLRGRRSRA